MKKKKAFYNAEDIMEILQVPKNNAKAIIKKLNKELEEKGYLFYSKVVNAKYFNERFYVE